MMTLEEQRQLSAQLGLLSVAHGALELVCIENGHVATPVDMIRVIIRDYLMDYFKNAAAPTPPIFGGESK